MFSCVVVLSRCSHKVRRSVRKWSKRWSQCASHAARSVISCVAVNISWELRCCSLSRRLDWSFVRLPPFDGDLLRPHCGNKLIMASFQHNLGAYTSLSLINFIHLLWSIASSFSLLYLYSKYLLGTYTTSTFASVEHYKRMIKHCYYNGSTNPHHSWTWVI